MDERHRGSDAAPDRFLAPARHTDAVTTMHRWTVGVVDIVRIEDADFSLPSERAVPEWCIPDLAPSRHEVGIAFSALALRSGATRIVVDPWMADDNPRDQSDATEHGARLLGELADAGFPADEVDLVVNTHLDGIGWNTRPTADGWVPSFPRARYLYPADEVAAINAGEEIYGRAGFEQLDAAIGVELVEPPLELTDEVTLVNAPGHNWGHVAVRVESRDELAIYPGHLVLTPWQIDDPSSEDNDDPQAAVAVATRRAILDELADRRGLLLTTLLGGSGGGVVRRAGPGFALA